MKDSIELLSQICSIGELKKYHIPTQFKKSIAELKNRYNNLKNPTTKQLIWHYKNQTTLIPLCMHCKQKETKWYDGNGGFYQLFCCKKCSNQYNLHTKEQTCINRYGVKNPMQCSEIQQKQKQTFLDNYGVSNPMRSNQVKHNRQQTNLKKYGVTEVLADSQIRKQITDTHLSKYGSTTKSSQHLSSQMDKLDNKEWLYTQHHTNQLSLEYIAQLIPTTGSTVGRYMKKHNIDVKRFRRSIGECEIEKNITQYYDGPILTNTRNIIYPYEIDIFLPEKNIGIEYDGIYWHSEYNKPKKYAIEKRMMCEKNNIRLLNIWDAEFISKQDIILSRIKQTISGNTKIYGRKCNIISLTPKQTKKFLIDNHIQGYCNSTINLGLIYNDELYAIMTFGPLRFNATQPHKYEMLRFCNKINYSVLGGASKLFNFFISKYSPHTIISYCDKRWNTGNVYEILNMTKISDTSPNYWYFHMSNPVKLYNRVQFQKHKLHKKLNIFNSNLSEWENMKLNNYNRIWDCGNYKFEWVKNT